MSQGNHVFSKENKGDSSMSKKNNLNLFLIFCQKSWGFDMGG